MLATALAVTPIASTLPVGGEVQAASVSEVEAELIDDLHIFYKHVGPIDINPHHIMINIPVKVRDRGEEVEEAYKDILKEIGTLVYSNYEQPSDLENALNGFRDSKEHQDNFQLLFEGKITSNDIVQFIADMKDQFFTNPMSYVTVTVGDAISFRGNIEKLVFDTKSTNTNLNGILMEATGQGLEGFFRDLTDATEYIDPDNSIRNALISSAFKEITTLNGPSTSTTNTSNKFYLSVNDAYRSKIANLNKMNEALHDVRNIAFDWYVGTQKQTNSNITFSNAGTYTVHAKVKGFDDIIGSKSITITAGGGTTPPPGGGTGPGPVDPGPVDPDPVDPDPVDPDPVDPIPPRPGQSVDAGDSIVVERETSETGQVKAVTKVDGAKLAEVISGSPAADRVSLKVERAEGEVAELRLPKAAVEALEGAVNKNIVVDIETDSGSVTIPVKELAAEKVRGMLDVAADADFEVSVFVNPASPQEAATVTATLESDARGLKAKSEIVDFSMIVRSGDKSQNVTRFSSYIHRELPVTDVTNPENLVVYNVDAAPVAVPTQAGTDRVRFSSYEFSKYVVVEREPVVFSDLSAGHWAEKAINSLAVRDVIVGFPNNEVRWAATTTRAEFAAILTRALALPSSTDYDDQFSDVNGSEWFVKDLLPAVEAGIVAGNTNGTFAPNNPITREEAAAMIARATQYIEFAEDKYNKDHKLDQFSDADKVSNWAKEDVELAVQAGIIVGNTNGTFNAKGNTLRAEVASMVNLLLEKADLK